MKSGEIGSHLPWSQPHLLMDYQMVHARNGSPGHQSFVKTSCCQIGAQANRVRSSARERSSGSELMDVLVCCVCGVCRVFFGGFQLRTGLFLPRVAGKKQRKPRKPRNFVTSSGVRPRTWPALSDCRHRHTSAASPLRTGPIYSSATGRATSQWIRCARTVGLPAPTYRSGRRVDESVNMQLAGGDFVCSGHVGHDLF